ncbi:NAD(P)/FAD-dependent oxidoreductase [Halorhabdus sp. CBA1104]|uniref:NAD(P)/FAD-dependent oxidoreductase n=1 Tax=unclassified Halorhabdus TaxID=2621901 RepID=UPI0012B2E213|nr:MULTISPECIES: NAD(P)/FAD-dependent oxidoreductase [unclassified Halorhabdus]QGN06574.1 NAD(P)/FAD-dependent oxidoreductase [Halorhabdus sp. CBA1104]
MERTDVVIVGGGPAGSSAARAAANSGADVVLVEKGVPRTDRDELGPDSTDAAGILDYWVDIMGEHPEDMPADVVLRELDGATFHGPSESVTIENTRIGSSYDGFGFTVDRARFDDWLRSLAEDAGADYRVGTSVTNVESATSGSTPTHRVHLADGTEIEGDALVLADGPQRTVTMDVLDQFLPAERSATDHLAPDQANHIAYQEYRQLPAELFDPDHIEFWWGVMPGHTAYPWIFPNDDGVARIGLTMPIGMDIEDVADPAAYALLDDEDDAIPPGRVYIRRLLEQQFPEYELDDFPIVEDRGKQSGREAYPISSTQPIESPTAANVAVVGGAMGATSAFHEGGDHVAIRTGKIAGELAAEGRMTEYNDAWQRAIGDEVRRNVTFAALVRGMEPNDWDRYFAIINRMLRTDGSRKRQALSAGLEGIGIYLRYRRKRWSYRGDRYVQLQESTYTV